MKKITIVLFVTLWALILTLAVGCVKENPNEVVITIDKGYDLRAGDTLEDYMDYLEDKNKLDYEEEGGMIVELNGVKNSLNSYWMLYTDDPDNSNSAWGEYEYKGKTLGSATLGAESLTLNAKCKMQNAK